jgi:diketogulonate reductase-like aldo/keto reductase
MKLNSGFIMPNLIFGTYKIKGSEVIPCLTSAYNSGFRHIDTASLYENEEDIGSWLESSKTPRDSLFLTTKIWPTDYRRISEACSTSLKKLKTSYLDLLLLHWPVSLKVNASASTIVSFDHIDRFPLSQAWSQMEDLLSSGKVRSIGVSNWNVSLLNDLLSTCRVPPACNQIEMHAYNQKKELIAFCQAFHVAPVVYRVIFRPPANEFKYKLRESPSDDQVIRNLALKYQVSPQQLLIKWALQRNCGVVIKSANPIRIKENWDAQKFCISDSDMQIISEIPHRGVFTNTEKLLGLYIE